MKLKAPETVFSTAGFCPGCGHGLASRLIGEVTEELGIQEKTLAVVDVACGPISIMCLWMSAWIGGASITGTSSKAYELGITAVWYVFIIVIGTVLFAAVMTKPVKRIGDRMRNLTFPDFIESRYDSKTRVATTVTTILAYVAYTASQFVAGASMLNLLTGWSLPACFLITTVVIVVYTAIGGLLAVTYTDIAQMLLLVVGVVVLAVPVSMNVMHTENLSFQALPESYFDIGAWGWPTIFALALSTIFSFFTSMDSYTPAGHIGTDTEAVFRSLGYTDDQIAEMRADGAIR